MYNGTTLEERPMPKPTKKRPTIIGRTEFAVALNDNRFARAKRQLRETMRLTSRWFLQEAEQHRFETS